MRLIFTLFILTYAFSVKAQSQEAYLLMRRADSLNMCGYVEEALQMAQQSIRWLEAAGIKDTTYANALAIEAWALYQVSPDEATDKVALEKGQRAFDLRKQLRGTEEHPDVADSYYFLGTVKGYMGDKKAINLTKKGLEIYENHRKPYDWDVVRGERFLAFQYTWGENRDREKASLLIKKSLDLIRQNPKREAWQVGRIMQGVGDVYGTINYDTSLIYYPEVIKNYSAAQFPANHQWMQATRTNISKILNKKTNDKRLRQAIDLMDSGINYKAKLMIDSCFEYYRNYPDPEYKAYAYYAKGRWYLQTLNLQQANLHLDTAIQWSEEVLKYELSQSISQFDSSTLFKRGDSYYMLTYYAQKSTIADMLGQPKIAQYYRQRSIEHYDLIEPFIDWHQKPESIIRQVSLLMKNNIRSPKNAALLNHALVLVNDIGSDEFYLSPKYVKGELRCKIYQLLAQHYEVLMQTDSSLLYWHKALETAKNTYSPTNFNVPSGEIYTFIANVYNQNKDYEKAIEYQCKALECFERSENGDGDPQTASALNSLATAIQFNCRVRNNIFDKNTGKFTQEFESVPILLQRSVKGMEKVVQQKNDTRFHRIPLQMTYLSLAEHYQMRYNAANDKRDLEQAGRYCDAAMKVFNEDKPFQLLAQIDEFDLRPGYANAAATYALSYQVFGRREDADKAFRYAELSKAAQLRIGLQDRVGKYEYVDSQILNQEYELRFKINGYAGQVGKTDSLLKYSLELEALLQRMQREYPAYYQAKYDNSLPTIRDVQQNLLSKDQTMVEYLEFGQNWYAFVIRPDTFAVVYLGSQPDAIALSEALTEAMRLSCANEKGKGRLKPKPDYETLAIQYNNAAYDLYTRFMKPVLSWLDTGSRVIIVPVGPLCNVPFQLLQSTEATKKTVMGSGADYLLKKYAFSYTYSAKLLELVQKEPKQPTTRPFPFAAFAPIYKNDPLRPLPLSKKNAETVAEMLQTQPIIGQDATAPLFLHMAEHLRVFLYTGHADADSLDGDLCRLFFTNTTISEVQLKTQLQKYGIPVNKSLSDLTQKSVLVRDLYNLRMNCDLAVLSACLSARGQQDGLEGIVSLTRAFVFSGTRCVVSTLWEALDDQSSDITTYFFENLKAGMTKDRALQQAQLKILGEIGGSTCSWGSFIVVGNTEALELK